MTTKKNVFIRFDYEHDEAAKILLTRQARLPDSPFEIADVSESAPLTGDWGDNVRRRMDNIDVVIVICGENAYLAKGVAAELTIAQEKNTPYFLLTAYANKTSTKPTSAMPSDKVYEWTWDNLKTLIGGVEITQK
jgi:hypothetical protein